MAEKTGSYPPPNSATPARLRRSANACQRCRRRKQKCDARLPKCSSCENAGTACLTYNAGRQSEVPRSLVSNLEAQISTLTKELDELKLACSKQGSIPAESSSSASQDPRDLVKSMGLIVLEASSGGKFVGTSSGITFCKMIMAAIKKDAITSPVFSHSNHMSSSSMPVAPSSLPPRAAADYMISAYFQRRMHHFPIIEPEQVQIAMENVYGNHPFHQDSLFKLYMVFAISLCGITNGSVSRQSQSEGCFKSALNFLDEVLNYSKSDLNTLLIVLLIAQYLSLVPKMGSCYQVTGMALRLCIDMGLHWETEAVLALDPLLLDERRRLFWTTYMLERELVTTLGRPFGIAEQSICVGMPNPYERASRTSENLPFNDERIHYRRVSNHMVSLYKLKSEIKHVLYHQLRGGSLAFPQPNYGLWLRDIEPRLEEWRASIPETNKAHPQSVYSSPYWWDASYSYIVLLLHRPSPHFSSPSPTSMHTMFEYSRKGIDSIKSLQRDGKVCTSWIWVHRMFLAGLTFVYCLWHSPEIRASTTLEALIDTTQSCASALAALAERFSGAAQCRDAFETLSAATLKWFIAKDSASFQQDGLSFSDFLKELKEQASKLPSDDLEAPADFPDHLLLLPNDPSAYSAYGEELSYAANWPSDWMDMDAMFDFGHMPEPTFMKGPL